MFYHVNKLNDEMFWVSSCEADYRYIVMVEEEDIEKAMEIADEEACKWGAMNEEELGDDYDYYNNAGYVEVVENALNKANIEATFFTEMESEEE